MSNVINQNGEYARHPMSHAYPEMSDAEFDTLVRSMLDNGYDESFPILVLDGQIIDGWHRYNAALKANVKPILVEWEGDQERLRDFIVLANSARRHLGKGAHAQALLALRAAGDADYTDADILRITGAAPSALAQQKRLRAADADKADRVATGGYPAETAVREALKEGTREQRAAAKRAKQAKAGWSGTLSANRTIAMVEAATRTGETTKQFINRAIDECIARTGNEAA